MLLLLKEAASQSLMPNSLNWLIIMPGSALPSRSPHCHYPLSACFFSSTLSPLHPMASPRPPSCECGTASATANSPHRLTSAQLQYKVLSLISGSTVQVASPLSGIHQDGLVHVAGSFLMGCQSILPSSSAPSLSHSCRTHSRTVSPRCLSSSVCVRL